MKKITLVILMVVVGFSAIAKQHKKKKKSKTTNEITAVTMHRTACFGRCPDYTIEITNTGMVTYTAARFCDDSGVFTKNIGAAKAMEVLNQFETYRVDTCKKEYDNRIPDLPGIIYTIKYKSKTQSIYNASFGPVFLKRLAEAMDAVGKKTDNSWQKAPDKK